MQTISITTKIKKKAAGDITDHVKTFEDACEILGIEGDVINGSISDALAGDADSIAAYAKLIIIARALNEGWVPDWSSSSQYKYIPWFKHKSGFGLSSYGYVGWATTTPVGSRLCFKTKELAEYAAMQFADLYNDYLSIK